MIKMVSGVEIVGLGKSEQAYKQAFLRTKSSARLVF